MNELKYFIGTGFYSGLIPKAPGTASSFAALIIIYFMIRTEWLIFIPVLILSASVLSIWVAGDFQEFYGKDPGRMTIDEWAGQGLTFFTISFSGTAETNIIILLAGFLLFRFFDILKPLGIKKVQNLPAGWGILTDDLIAGLYALICLKTLIFVWPNFLGLA